MDSAMTLTTVIRASLCDPWSNSSLGLNPTRAGLLAMLVGLLLWEVSSGGKLLAADKATADSSTAGYREIIAPFFKQHCVRCHGPLKQAGEFHLERHLKTDFLDPSAKEKWGEVVNVLNSHEMPPEKEPQPKPAEVAKVVDWITAQLARAEVSRRDGQIVLRRLNRDEYRNTIRDLTGVDLDVASFPQEPTAGGFDNNGKALTMSPMHTELYLDAARKVLDRALVEGKQPPSIKWRFEPEVGDGDHSRVRYDGQNAIVHGAKNRVEGNFKVMHHDSWDRHLNARDFRMKHEGDYVIRVRAGGKVPTRQQVVESARKFLDHRFEEQMKNNAKGEKWHREAVINDIKHFETDRIYDYGPPRLKLIRDLGGQPKVITEFDVTAAADKPDIYEFRTRMTQESAGITIEYAYPIPRVLENFWMQGHDNFARPEAWVDWFELEGPLYESWPPPSHRLVLGDAPQPKQDVRVAARAVLTRFMPRAYRRPVTATEVDDKLKLFDTVLKQTPSPSFVQAIKTPLIAVMVSPHFLYLAEPGRDEAATASVKPTNTKEANTKPATTNVASPKSAATTSAARTLTDHELAARLSYFLWSSMPDAELTQLADKGQLHDKATLAKQVTRLLTDPKSEAFVQNFAGQWLGLREVGANPPAADLFPQYDRHLEVSMIDESRAFFAEILKHDLSVMNFVGSDFVVINERLARFYGIPDVRGDHFRRVAVPNGVHRGGVVTQASILTITSNGTRTSPVKRGTWVMKNLLGTDPGLPVANVGDIAPKVPGIDKATVRQRLEIHRQLAQCARCHNKIDPLGFALENFDAAGDWRDREGFGYKGRVSPNDPLIDASSKLPDGTAIVGVDGLRQALLKKEDLFLSCLANKLLTYALGRELGVADQSQIKAAIANTKQNQHTLRSLIQFVVQSVPFGTK